MILRHFLSQSLGCQPTCGLLGACRYYARWSRSVKRPYDPFVARRPWMSYPASNFLANRLARGQTVFEYGGGGSTLYFLDRGLEVTTVEHDPDWFDRIRKSVLAISGCSGWTGILREPVRHGSAVGEFDPSDPDDYVSSGPRYHGCCFGDYARAIDPLADESFDLIVVDGRSRPSCVKHAVAKIKRGGYLLLDNTERSHYLTHRLDDHLTGFKTVFDCHGPVAGLLNFSRTTVWKRTAGNLH